MTNHRLVSSRGRVRSEHSYVRAINLTSAVLSDKWNLRIIRDMIFGNRRHFRALLQNSEEGIASNILAGRLKILLEQRIITKAGHPSHKQKVIYSLTERGIELLPVLAQMGGWGLKYLAVTEQQGSGVKLLIEGGPKLWKGFMSELRAEHLGESTGRKSRLGALSICTLFWQRASLRPDRRIGTGRRSRLSKVS